MNGTVKWWGQERDRAYGQIRGGLSGTYEVSGREVEPDCLGRIMLIPDEPVEFEFEFENRPRHANPNRRDHHAIQVKRPWKETDIDDRGWREICEVVNENYLIRQIGGLLTVVRSDDLILCPEQVVEVSIEPPAFGNTWRAHNIKLIHENAAEFDWSSVPYPSNTASAPVSVVQMQAEQHSI